MSLHVLLFGQMSNFGEKASVTMETFEKPLIPFSKRQISASLLHYCTHANQHKQK